MQKVVCLKFEKLFQQASIGKMKLKNRIVMAPTGCNITRADGFVTRRMISYYVERAKGGVSLIIVEGTPIDPLGVGIPYQLRLYDDKFIPSFKQLANAIKEYEVRTSIQTNHIGALTSSKLIGQQPLSPSGVPPPGILEKPKEMTIDDIEAAIEAHAEGARRAADAGFDSVQILAAEGLIHQFLSPYYNKRTDDYGGDIKGRMKLLIRIIKRIKDKLGKDFPIICRINGEDKNCLITVDDSRAIAVGLEEAGADAIELINGSSFESFGTPIYTMEVPRGNFAHLAEGVKKLIKIPVISNIRINDPSIAEEILQAGKADLVSMARALISDPELPNKAANERLEDINRCIACMTCLHEAFSNNELICVINAQAGLEEERWIKPANRVKKVLVVGGGPAGLEAARVAALRGHRVSLYEKNSQLGGTLLLAAKPPHKDEIWSLIDYLSAQVKNLGVSITLGCEATYDLVRKEKPDVSIVATGSLPAIPKIDIEKGNIVFASEILNGTVEAGQNVIVVGGGVVGAETAEFLACKNKHVSIVDMLGVACADMPMFARDDLMHRLQELRVNILTETKVERVKGNTIEINKKGQKQTVKADTVIIATGFKSNRKLAEELESLMLEVYMIGDCLRPRKILQAIHEGFSVGNKI